MGSLLGRVKQNSKKRKIFGALVETPGTFDSKKICTILDMQIGSVTGSMSTMAPIMEKKGMLKINRNTKPFKYESMVLPQSKKQTNKSYEDICRASLFVDTPNKKKKNSVTNKRNKPHKKLYEVEADKITSNGNMVGKRLVSRHTNIVGDVCIETLIWSSQ